MLFCDTHDLVWGKISVSEKGMKNCIVKIINNVGIRKNDEGGLFLLKVNGENSNASNSYQICSTRSEPCSIRLLC